MALDDNVGNDNDNDNKAPYVGNIPQNVRRAISLGSSGYLSRAVSSLLQSPPVDVSEEVIRKLKQLHPDASAAIPALPSGAPTVLEVGDEDLENIIKRQLCNGSAPGPSGWTGELIKPLIYDEQCLPGLKALVADIANGNLDDHSRLLLLSSILMPVPKGASDIRPIAIGETFVRLATRYLLSLLPPGHEIFKDIQFGVKIPGGCELALHSIQAALQKAGSSGVVFSADFANAFNTRHRSAIAAALFANAQCAGIWRYFHWAYSVPSPLLVYDAVGNLYRALQSAEGVRQGDPPASLAFALSVQHLYQHAIAEHGDRVSASAILDDLNLVGDWKDVLACFVRLRDRAQSEGFLLRLPKCRILWPHDDHPPAELVAAVRELNVTLVTKGMEVLGSFVGEDEPTTANWANEQVQQHRALFEAIDHPAMPAQLAYHLLKKCALPRFGYIARTVNPDHIAGAITQWDDRVSAAFYRKTGIGAAVANSPLARQQVALPTRLGGLGFRPFSTIAPVAYVSSISTALPTVLKTIHVDPVANTPLPRLTLFAGFAKHHQALATRGVPSSDVFHANFSRHLTMYAVQPPTSQLQKHITQDLDTLLYNTIRRSSTQTGARLLSASHPLATRWLTVLPANEALRLNNLQFQLSVRRLLALPPSDAMPSSCACGTNPAVDSSHYHSCPSLRKREMNTRHDLIKQNLARLARLAGFAGVTVEPKMQQGRQLDRADLEVVGIFSTTLVDIAVTHPLSISYVAAASTTQLATARSRELTKHRHYDEQAAHRQARFIPFVLETYGAWGKETEAVLRVLAREAAANHVTTAGGFLDLARSQLAFALQRGNALVELGGLRSARVLRR